MLPALTLLLTWMLAATPAGDRAAARADRLHIILIVADDLGWNDVGFHGSLQIPTPNIDALASSGVILNRYYVNPLCTPSRSALLTGRYSSRIGMQHDVIHGAEPRGLPLQYRILPEDLSALGYVTHAVGKWHLGSFRREFTPTARGFQSHFGNWLGYCSYYTHTLYEVNLGQAMWGSDLRCNMTVASDAFGEYLTDAYTREAVRIIRGHPPDRPLFLYVSHNAVHSALPWNPLEAPRDAVERFAHIADVNRRLYAAMVSKLDESVGLLLQALHSSGLLDHSVLVFTTDNGGPAAGFDRNAASNWPLRGVKGTLWEGGIRGAAFAWSPLFREPRRVSTELMDVTDWLPTLLEAAGGSPPEGIDGVSQWRHLCCGEPSPRSDILHQIDPWESDYSAITVGKHKLVAGTIYGGAWDGWYGPSGRDVGVRPETSYREATRTSEKTLGILRGLRMDPSPPTGAQILCGPPPPLEQASSCSIASPCIFDVEEDPCEYVNLYHTNETLRKELLAKLLEFRKTTVTPINALQDLRADPKYFGYVWTNWNNTLEEGGEMLAFGSS